MRGGNLLKEDDNKEKNLTQLEIDNVIDKTINLSIILKLLKINVITEKQYYILKDKIQSGEFQ